MFKGHLLFVLFMMHSDDVFVLFPGCISGMFISYIWVYKAAGVGAMNTGISTGEGCLRALISAG